MLPPLDLRETPTVHTTDADVHPIETKTKTKAKHLVEPPLRRMPLSRRGFVRLGVGALFATVIGRGIQSSNAAVLGAHHDRNASGAPIQLASFAQPVTSLADIQRLVDGLVKKSFPELENVPLRIESYDDKPYYSFEARPAALVGSVAENGYILRVNRGLFDHGLPEYVVEAVLAHELSHAIWYLDRGSLALVAGLAAFVGDRENFEKATDLEAVRRGYGEGLAAHRRWLLDRFPDFVHERTGLYLSAEEIERAAANPADPLWEMWAKAF